jgi:hypothetical protein
MSVSLSLFLCPSTWNNSAHTGRIFVKFGIAKFFENLTNFKFHLNMTRITSTLHEDQNTFIITSRKFLLTMKNVSHSNCWENQNTIFMFKNFCRRSLRLWDNVKNIVEPDRPQMTMWRIRIACWIHRATNAPSEYVIPLLNGNNIEAYASQHYCIRTYFACLLYFIYRNFKLNISKLFRSTRNLWNSGVLYHDHKNQSLCHSGLNVTEYHMS